MSRPRAWVFGVASIPYGAFNGLVAVALPYLLRQRGFSVDRISSLSAMIQLPAIWYFLWAPLVDFGWRRRTWIVALSIASAILAAFALASPSVGAMVACMIVASVLNQPISSAIGGLVAHVVPEDRRGRTGGWSQAGILGGGIAAGGLMVYFAGGGIDRSESLVAATLIALPALAVLTIAEPRRDAIGLGRQVATMLAELRGLLRRRDVRIGFVFFISPIGAGALMNLFSAIGTDFHADASLVVVAVAAGGVATPVGALVAGYLCDRFPTRRMYCAGGLLAVLSVVLMLALPLHPATYLTGAAAYGFSTGFAYATFSALAYELLGAGGLGSGTQFTLFMAAVNIPVVYMVRVDGMAHAHFGVRGMLAVDAAANLIATIALLYLAMTPSVA